jgi:predicted dehydrogenase
MRRSWRRCWRSPVVFVLTHNYTGYPMIRQAREMVAAGELGEIRVVQAEYPQDWLTNDRQTGQKQAAWRTDPKQSGAGGAIGDIGTHAYNLARFVTGLELEELSADLTTFVRAASSTTTQHVMLRFKGGAQGHALGEPGGAGQRERPEAARLRHQGRARMGAGRPELSLVHALRRAEALITRGGAGAGGRPPA